MHYNYNLPEVTLNVCSFFWGKIYDILIHTIINMQDSMYGSSSLHASNLQA